MLHHGLKSVHSLKDKLCMDTVYAVPTPALSILMETFTFVTHIQ